MRQEAASADAGTKVIPRGLEFVVAFDPPASALVSGALMVRSFGTKRKDRRGDGATLGGCWSSAIRPIEGVVEFLFEFPPLIGIVPEIPNNSYQHDADQRSHNLIERAIHNAAQYAPVRP